MALFRTLLIAVTAAALLTGCVTVITSTSQPSAARTFNITTPVPVGTLSPTATATPAPTPAATLTQTPTASPIVAPSLPSVPTVAPTATAVPAQADVIFVDEMDDPTSGWSTGATDDWSVAYEDGVLRMAIDAEAGVWTSRSLGAEFGVVLAAAGFTLTSGDGGFGAMCSGADGTYYGAVGTVNAELIYISIAGSELTVLARHTVGEVTPLIGSESRFGVECFGTQTGALRLVAIVPGAGPLPIYEQDEGPATFNQVAIFGEAYAGGVSIDVEPAAAFGIPDEGVTPEGEDLLVFHVPEEWENLCVEVPVSADALAIVHCFLQPEGDGPELAQYVLFATAEGMNAQYEQHVLDFGGGQTGSCTSGSNEEEWTIDGEVQGTLQCAQQAVGIRFDWTDNRSNIVGTLIDFDTNFFETFNVWAEATGADNPREGI